MKDKRLPGQSQLDYLWTTYKYYEVSNKLQDSQDEYIPTQSLVTKLLKELETPKVELFEVVESLPIVGDNKIYLLQDGENYSAYVYVNNVAVLIGSTGSDLELTKKVDKLNEEVDDLKNKLIWFEY